MIAARSACIGRRAALLGATGLIVPRSIQAEPDHAAADLPPLMMTEVAPGIHVRQGVYEDASAANDDAIANIGFIVGNDAVAVIDPGGSRDDGLRLHASIRQNTSLPIRYVILSHMHPDHVFGCAAFTDDDPIFVAHANMLPALVSRGEYYRRVLADLIGLDAAGDYAKPNRAITGLQTIDLGDRVLELRAHGVAHTDNDLSIVDRRTGTLWAADLLFVDRVPSLDGSLVGWIHELDALKALPCSRAIPGHGPASVAWPAAADNEQRYLTTILTETRQMIANGADIEVAVDHVAAGERSQWALFDDYNGRNVTVAFKELEWE